MLDKTDQSLLMGLDDRLADGRPREGALFSQCETYRYRLWRYWDPARRPLGWILLNPGTVDAPADDNRVRRCQKWSHHWGYGGFELTSLFALRSTDPAALRTHSAPIGPNNDQAIMDMLELTDTVICAWGNDGALANRAALVRELIAASGATPHVLTPAGTCDPRRLDRAPRVLRSGGRTRSGKETSGGLRPILLPSGPRSS